MVTDPDDGDEDDEWRFSLEDLEEREDGEDAGGEDAGGEDVGSDATESSNASGATASSDATESSNASGATASSDATESSNTNAASSDATESAADVSEDGDEGGDGFSAGVAGQMEFDEKLEAGEINVENALFVVFGVLLAVAFFVAFLNLL